MPLDTNGLGYLKPLIWTRRWRGRARVPSPAVRRARCARFFSTWTRREQRDSLAAPTLQCAPVLLGTGKRIFSEGAPPRELALVGTKAVSSGVIISTYRPNGPLRTGSFDDAAA